MRVVVFGAAGRTGSKIVERSLGHGHAVTAFVHATGLALEHPNLTIVTGDVRDADAVSSAIKGAEGVAFALSQGTGGGKDIHEVGIANVIYAMTSSDVFKLAAISAAGTFARTSPLLPLGFRARVATTMRAVYDDLENMEMRIMASELEWTIVRPVGLSDEPATGDYRLSLDGSLLPKAARISREDVAGLALKSLETDIYRRKAVVIGQ